MSWYSGLKLQLLYESVYHRARSTISAMFLFHCTHFNSIWLYFLIHCPQGYNAIGEFVCGFLNKAQYVCYILEPICIYRESDGFVQDRLITHWSGVLHELTHRCKVLPDHLAYVYIHYMHKYLWRNMTSMGLIVSTYREYDLLDARYQHPISIVLWV